MDRALPVDGSVGNARRVVAARRFLDERGVLLGLAVVALVFGALIGPQFFRRGQPRADRSSDRDRLRGRARHDDDRRVGWHRSVGRIVVALSTVVTALLLGRDGRGAR
jgi:hypothetical protein